MEQDKTATNRKVKYFPEDVDTKDKMLGENGRAIESIYCPEEGYAILYNSVKRNYETRELDGNTIYALMEEVAYRDGVRHGRYCSYELVCPEPVGIDFYPVKAVEGHYINGKKVGRWNYYDNKGNVKDVKMFVGGKDVTNKFAKGQSKDSISVLQKLSREK